MNGRARELPHHDLWVPERNRIAGTIRSTMSTVGSGLSESACFGDCSVVFRKPDGWTVDRMDGEVEGKVC